MSPVEKFDLQDVEKAFERIKPYLRTTPVVESLFLNSNEREYFYKLESLQTVRSFKIRGALNKILSLTNLEKKKGVVTISSGNHGIATAYASQLLGIEKVEVIVPIGTPKNKIEKIEQFGGQVKQIGKNYDEAHIQGMKYVRKSEMNYIDSYYSDPLIYSGQGTITLELIQQLPLVDTIVIPIGGGSLITGIAVAAKSINPAIRIIGVQTAACPAMIKSIEERKFYEEYPTKDSICESLVGGIGRLSYEMLPSYVDELIEVDEADIAAAVTFMAKKEKIIAEPGSCTTIAAIRKYGEKIGGKTVVAIISGGNIDEQLFYNLLAKNKE
ncbi:threonine/serine dehydratase [Liquorilactobacillus mali]|nr:threonine/serine dehydratase [Liquorilactobacillus mali]QFQ75829.1 threonine/serine dehydratase [Liquorilactobacillus mali]